MWNSPFKKSSARGSLAKRCCSSCGFNRTSTTESFASRHKHRANCSVISAAGIRLDKKARVTTCRGRVLSSDESGRIDFPISSTKRPEFIKTLLNLLSILGQHTEGHNQERPCFIPG